MPCFTALAGLNAQCTQISAEKFVSQTMCDLLRDYREGTLDRDAMYNAWAGDSGQSARRDACQDLFF